MNKQTLAFAASIAFLQTNLAFADCPKFQDNYGSGFAFTVIWNEGVTCGANASHRVTVTDMRMAQTISCTGVKPLTQNRDLSLDDLEACRLAFHSLSNAPDVFVTIKEVGKHTGVYQGGKQLGWLRRE